MISQAVSALAVVHASGMTVSLVTGSPSQERHSMSSESSEPKQARYRNYRVTFGPQDFPKGVKNSEFFKQCWREYYPVIQDIYEQMHEFGVQDYWYFFEPYVEFTWICPGRLDQSQEEELLQQVVDLLEALSMQNIKTYTPEKDGTFVGWYHKSTDEENFEWKTHVISRQMADLFYEYRSSIEEGKGEDLQIARRFHLLCNQCGLDYTREGSLLFKRGLICKLFSWFGQKWTRRIWRYVLFQKY